MVATTNSPFSPETAPEKAEHGPCQDGASRAPGAPRREEAKKVLILDDEPHLLAIYKKIIGRLASRPDVRVSDNAGQALALLDAEPFDLFITDLRMPKIDGFQVLLSVRRRFPTLLTVAITALGDQQYRARAYASGIDLYTEKPTTPTEIRLFGECIEALLTQRGHDGGFRGIQSKSLMDLIQIECLSQNSSILRITHGSLEGRLWIRGGDVVDAQLQDFSGEEAFKQIFGWKTGHFEIFPGDERRPRTIYTSYESLLLDSAQTLDESAAVEPAADVDGLLAAPRMSRELQPLSTVRGVECLLMISGPGQCESWGLENPEEFAGWTHRVLREFHALGESLNAGPLRSVEAVGSVRGAVLLPHGGRHLMAGLDRRFDARMVRAAGKEIATHLGKQ